MRNAAILMTVFAVASCAPMPPSQAMMAKSAMQEEKLQQALAGRVPGRPVSCLPHYRTKDQTTISDHVILFRDGATIYRTDPPGGCRGLESGRFALLTRQPTASLCSGDFVQLIDTQSGMIGGTCTFGEFVPYTRAPG